MKFFFNIFLVLYLVCKPVLPMLEYVVNYDHISEVLCINKNKPELHCNGKCYLGKELAKNNQQETSKTKNQTQKILDLYIPTDISEIQNSKQESVTDPFFTYQTDYSYLFLSHFLRPPII